MNPSKQKQVEQFNAACKVGDAVSVTRDNGAKHFGMLSSEAYLLGGHTAVAHVTGIRGCYALERIKREDPTPLY